MNFAGRFNIKAGLVSRFLEKLVLLFDSKWVKISSVNDISLIVD